MRQKVSGCKCRSSRVYSISLFSFLFFSGTFFLAQTMLNLRKAKVSPGFQSYTHKWANHKLPHSSVPWVYLHRAKLQLILSSGNWDVTLGRTQSAGWSIMYCPMVLWARLWFLRGWSQNYSKVKSDPITGSFFLFCRANTSYSCTGRQITKITAVKLTLHKRRPSNPDGLYGGLSSNTLSSVHHTEWRAHIDVSMTS